MKVTRSLLTTGIAALLLAMLLLLPAAFNLLPVPGSALPLASAPWLIAPLLILAAALLISFSINFLSISNHFKALVIGFAVGLLLSLSAEGSSGPMLGSGFSLSYFLICGFSGALVSLVFSRITLQKGDSNIESVMVVEDDEKEWSPEEIELQYESKLTTREKEFRWKLHNAGYRYNLHGKFQKTRLPGLPTLVLPRYHSVIFIRSCSNHGHVGCRDFNINEIGAISRDKLYHIKAKDDLDYRTLRGKGWKVIEVWECKLSPENLNSTLIRVTRELDVALQRRGSAV